MRSRLRNQDGSVLIETLAAAAIVLLLLSMGFGVVYLAFAKAWLMRSARESAVCLSSLAAPERCRTKLQITLARGVPIGEVEVTEFRTDARGAHVVLSLRLPPLFAARSRLLPVKAFVRRPDAWIGAS